MNGSSRLVLAHFWVAFAAFAAAIPLGAWQMLVRSPLHQWVNPEHYYRAVTAHGSTLAYIFPTLVAMGFGFAVCAVSLGRPMHGLQLAWASLALVVTGAVMAVATVAAGEATVLYTFYPPLGGSPYYYLGILIAVIGSWIWVGLMVSHFRRWKRDHPGLPVPLAMFATTAGALLWAWTSLGAGAEILFLILPNAFGWTTTIDPALARVLFSWTLHAIVYFWLIPSYIAFYVLLPQAAGGPLYSDKMGRVAFLLLLIFSMPIGLHHLFADPQIGTGFKFLHTVFTAMVAVPTLLTIFTICASLEIAGRLRGGRGLFGWIAALPWDRPLVLASGFSLLMLGFGGASGCDVYPATSTPKTSATSPDRNASQPPAAQATKARRSTIMRLLPCHTRATLDDRLRRRRQILPGPPATHQAQPCPYSNCRDQRVPVGDAKLSYQLPYLVGRCADIDCLRHGLQVHIRRGKVWEIPGPRLCGRSKPRLVSCWSGLVPTCCGGCGPTAYIFICTRMMMVPRISTLIVTPMKPFPTSVVATRTSTDFAGVRCSLD